MQYNPLGNVLLRAAIHVDVLLTRATYQLLQTMFHGVYRDCCGLFQQENATSHKAGMV